MNQKHKNTLHRIKVPARMISYGERMQLRYQTHIEAVRQAKQDKRNTKAMKTTKAEREAIEAQLSAPENEV